MKYPNSGTQQQIDVFFFLVLSDTKFVFDILHKMWASLKLHPYLYVMLDTSCVAG